jgi:hypothetical protein
MANDERVPCTGAYRSVGYDVINAYRHVPCTCAPVINDEVFITNFVLPLAGYDIIWHPVASFHRINSLEL